MNKTEQRFEVQIPFSGFYYSIHDDEMTREVESLADSWADTMSCDIPEDLMNLFWDGANFGNAHIEYVKAYIQSFGDEYLQGDAAFTGITSPREYNFETDRAFATIGRNTLARIWRETDRAIFERVACERHTSRDGFISFYSSDWVSWGRLSEWDHNQLQTLLIAYLETERGSEWDQWAEYELCEDLNCNGYIHQWIWEGDDPKATRAWKIFNYLTYDRANRAVKTMAQWRNGVKCLLNHGIPRH